MNSNSQNQQILMHLKSGKTLTAMISLRRFGCFRLAARVYDLREAGYAIQSRVIEASGKRIAEYYLAP
jgi:hypothetical protein